MWLSEENLTLDCGDLGKILDGVLSSLMAFQYFTSLGLRLSWITITILRVFDEY